MLNHTNNDIRIIRFASLLLIAFIASCSAKTPVELSNGTKVDNCTDYNVQRKALRIKEHVNNILFSSEYLECSLNKPLLPVDNPKATLALIAKKLKARQLPLSIGPSVDRKATLHTAGLVVSTTSNSLIFDKENKSNKDSNRNLVIILKGKLSTNQYLVWVVDEILNATYRAYYPAIITITAGAADDDDTVTAAPYYAGGF